MSVVSRPSKEHILDEIRRYASEHDGATPGKGRFETATGIKEADWMGRYWAKWSDAVGEAGLQPNVLNPAYSEEHLFRHLAEVVRDLGRFPTRSELKLRRTNDSDFPSYNVFTRFGDRRAVIARLVQFCTTEPGYKDVGHICAPLLTQKTDEGDTQSRDSTIGYVYMIKSDKHYKIGKTNDIGRRSYEIGLQMPERSQLVHTIKTDDRQASNVTGTTASLTGARTANGSYCRRPT